jgi:pentose-5-phosphate-3-epimerase
LDNLDQVAAAGADVIVSGSGIFGRSDYRETIAAMRAAGSRARGV